MKPISKTKTACNIKGLNACSAAEQRFKPLLN